MNSWKECYDARPDPLFSLKRVLYGSILIAMATMILTACGGGGGGGASAPPPAPTLATISAQPLATTVYETQAATFSNQRGQHRN